MSRLVAKGLIIIGEAYPQGAQGILHAGKRSVDGHALGLGNDFKREVGFGAHQINLALFSGQLIHGVTDTKGQFMIGTLLGRSVVWIGHKAFQRRVRGVGTAHGLLEAVIGFAFPAEVDNPVTGDSEQPGEQTVALVSVKTFDGTNPNILKDIFCNMGIADQSVNEPVERNAGLVHNASKRIDVSIAVLLKQAFKVSFLHKG